MADRPEIPPVYGIGLCGGALGLELALEVAIPGYRTVLVLERETAVAGRMAQRIEEGSLAEASGGPRNRQDSVGQGHQTTIGEQAERWGTPSARDWKSGDAAFAGWEDVLVRYPWLRPSYSQAEAESDFRDLVDGMASLVAHERTGALRALGNGVVSLQASVAFTILLRRVLKNG